ncbi:CubicO group peptidase, beta-lactamase class C family [Muriicola jejuensis]|uniref:Serine hydrolase n=1 Tax=Muriicola jejuensis TaxID=504488 RepID=A0A6P0UAZ6_9FLAO|nr:serine hydrolase domain-containing protein [Muriicola jejuensis]NER09680.1 serine hydrolase [Muriicola jejuensis]SMP06682.1 CubicO group peptidase, beta-lactamase class C family [Muriicola jejuensis]
MKPVKAFLILFLAFSSGCRNSPPQGPSGEALSKKSPSSVGMSRERLDKIEAMLQASVDKGEIPGAVALIVRKGGIVLHEPFGYADYASQREMTRDAIFRIASQSKAITSTAVMILWEEGRFRLDDPISDYIPEFKNPQVLESFNEADSTYTSRPAEKEISIRHLLTHTSGIGYGVIDGDERIRKIYAKAGIVDLYTTEDIPIGDNIKKLAALPLHHDPGASFTYSEGLDVLGYFIEIVSGMPFDEFLQTRLFEPLGMDDTGFYLDIDKAERLVTVQRPVENGWEKYPVTFYDTDYPIKGAKRFFSGGAGLCSTARDYAIFLQMYLNGGRYNGVRILSPTTIRSIMGDQMGIPLGDSGYYYGLAFGVVTPKGEALGGTGTAGTFDWGGYFNTQYFADPEEKVIGVLMKQTQGLPKDDTGWKFRQMTFASIEE